MITSEQDQDIAVKDSISVCARNPISDVTFYDSANIITRIEHPYRNGFPWKFTEITRARNREQKELLTVQLKEGKEIPMRPFHEDWIILLILSGAFIYSLIRTISKKLFPEVTRFFFFRGINDPASRDVPGLFQWQSTLINLISFFNLALFCYITALYYNIVPHQISGIVFWLIAFAIIVAAVTGRHAICAVTGSISGESDAFSEYVVTVYQSYRFDALILFILVIFISYTDIFPVKTLILTGFITTAALYLVRLIRLFLIFIKRNISILYLILYLCALEFLPVIILLKYFTGLF